MQADYSIYYGFYHPNTPEHAASMRDYFVEVLKPWLDGETQGLALDVGCGFGFAMLALQKLGFTAEGVELSPQQAARAQARGLNVTVADDPTSWLRSRPRRYSVVLLLDVLEHIPKEQQLATLEAIRECLVPGGRLIIQVPNASSILAPRWFMNDWTHVWSFTEHSLIFALLNAQFERITISNEKGLGRRPSLRLWRSAAWRGWRRYVVRWLWLQVYLAEMPQEGIDKISFELNLTGVAFRPRESTGESGPTPSREGLALTS
jgi:SAM-dependent methyltransferase